MTHHPLSPAAVEAMAIVLAGDEYQWSILEAAEADALFSKAERAISAAFEQSRAEGNAMDGGQYLTSSGDYHYFDLGKNHGLSALVTIIRKAK